MLFEREKIVDGIHFFSVEGVLQQFSITLLQSLRTQISITGSKSTQFGSVEHQKNTVSVLFLILLLLFIYPN